MPDHAATAGGDGLEKILTREHSALTARLRAAAALGRRETVEAQR